MPESVRRALRDLGHEVDSVVSLRLKGLDNSRLYREITRREGHPRHSPARAGSCAEIRGEASP